MMEKPTSNDIVSSIFKRFEGKYISMPELRIEVKKLARGLDFQEPADPERNARAFYADGILQKNDASYYCYDSSKISSSLVQRFNQFQYLYDRLPKNFKPTAFIKIPLGKVPENENAVNFISSEIEKYKSNYGTYGLHYAILKYALELAEKNVSNKELCEKSKIGDSYTSEISKMKSIFDIIKQRNEIDYSSDNKINDSQIDEISELKKQQTSYISNNSQIIYYGVPGSGKSHKIDNELETKIQDKNQREQQVMRVVFHPEYTNADFVGQILPVLDSSGVNYKFKAGPFTRILKRALKNPNQPYYLIIEEINRGNAAAIFGDLFQLLDRNSDGWSSYPIENLDINSFIRSKDDSYNDKKEIESTVKVGNMDFTENTEIQLPPNLSILATMNTSDQNVFTLDNAFQRRWNMELVENTFGSGSENQKNALLENSKVTWENFQTQINKKISGIAQENNLSSMVDKRLGCWFVKASEDKEGKFIIKEEAFKNKILKYLWDDAFKFNHEVFVESENFEDLLKKVDMQKSDFGVFKEIQFAENNNDGHVELDLASSESVDSESSSE